MEDMRVCSDRRRYSIGIGCRIQPNVVFSSQTWNKQGQHIISHVVDNHTHVMLTYVVNHVSLPARIIKDCSEAKSVSI